MSLSVGAPVGESGEGVCLQETTGDSGRKALEMGHPSLWDIC